MPIGFADLAREMKHVRVKRILARKTDGSIFVASTCASNLSSSEHKLVKNCTKIGTDALYMEMVIERGPLSWSGQSAGKPSGLTAIEQFVSGTERFAAC